MDDPKQGAKTRKKDPTVPDRETLYVLQDDATSNNRALPNKVNIIRKDEDHKEARDITDLMVSLIPTIVST